MAKYNRGGNGAETLARVSAGRLRFYAFAKQCLGDDVSDYVLARLWHDMDDNERNGWTMPAKEEHQQNNFAKDQAEYEKRSDAARRGAANRKANKEKMRAIIEEVHNNPPRTYKD